jgi:hypothetical protein
MEESLRFVIAFVAGVGVAWPILLALLLTKIGLGLIIGWLERWSVFDGVYFALITAFTVGYGDLAPTRKSTKTIAVIVAFIGIIFAGIIVAIALHAGRQVLPID